MSTASRPRLTQAERRAATESALVAAGRRLFAERGFAATSIEELTREAGVTRGALYHYFAGKEELFRAVFVQLEEELDAHVRTAATAAEEPWELFLTGCRAALEFIVRSDYRQIVLLDGPAVLGLSPWHEIDSTIGLPTMRAGVEFLMQSGVFAPAPALPIAVLLFGALNQAAVFIAQAEDPEATMRELLGGLDHVLGRLRA